MKDSEFIELLNLYVDHEISPEQAARLEAEVTANAERRRRYHQYCMMHKACSLLSDQFDTAAMVERAGARSKRSASRSFWSWSGGFYAAGLLAAASVAIVVGVRMRGGAAARPAAVPAIARTAVPRPAAAAPAAGPDSDLRVLMTLQRPVSFPSPFGAGELQTVLNTRAWGNPAQAGAAAPSPDFAWMNTVQLAPLPAASFEPMAPFNRPAAVMIGSADGPDDLKIDNAAFQWFTR